MVFIIKTPDDLDRALHNMPCTDGGYPTVMVMQDSGVLCGKCAAENKSLILESMRDGYDRQWIPYALQVNYEDPSLYCDKCGNTIEPAYGE